MRPDRKCFPMPGEPGTFIVPLTRGGKAFISECDLQRVSQWSWSLWDRKEHRGRFYARANVATPNGRSQCFLHTFIMEPLDGLEVDHRDGNGLNCRRGNLRASTHQQNMQNMRRHGEQSSVFKGVSWFKRDSLWRAYIVNDAKQYHLGYHESEIDAALAYNAAAKDLFGEFANLNMIPSSAN